MLYSKLKLVSHEIENNRLFHHVNLQGIIVLICKQLYNCLNSRLFMQNFNLALFAPLIIRITLIGMMYVLQLTMNKKMTKVITCQI